MGRGRGGFAGLLLLAALAGCAPRPAPPAPQPRYLVGQPYQMGGVWSYPREDFSLVETGLAAVAADQRSGRRTANGEIYDPAALTGAHRTLQLPAILRVTNLETGLELDIRLNDRGPGYPGRVVELSRRAAELLGLRTGGTAQVRIAVLAEPSRALAAGLPNPEAPRIEVATAPVGAVQREDLPRRPAPCRPAGSGKPAPCRAPPAVPSRPPPPRLRRPTACRSA
jgi:rare lipoprotein A